MLEKCCLPEKFSKFSKPSVVFSSVLDQDISPNSSPKGPQSQSWTSNPTYSESPSPCSMRSPFFSSSPRGFLAPNGESAPKCLSSRIPHWESLQTASFPTLYWLVCKIEPAPIRQPILVYRYIVQKLGIYMHVSMYVHVYVSVCKQMCICLCM